MRLILLAMFSFLLSADALYAQVKKTVTGVVRSSDGTALLGATVNEKGTRNSVITDEKGAFSISVSPNATLAISYAGYTAQEVSAAGTELITVSLQSATGTMSEVVVTGFGETRNRRTLGYAITQISGDDIRRTGNPNPINALRGMVPGLQITPNVGGPQASTRFLIRGSANLDPYGNQPLVVVDDIVMDDQVIIPNRGGEQDFGNILKNLNPDDIESISVLKGGAVTALYGSRASNGVILIRTKKGFSQRGLGVAVSQSLLFERAYRTVDLQNRFGAGIHANDWARDAAGNLSPNPNTYFFSFGPEMTGQQFTDITGERRANNPGVNNPLALYGTGLQRNTNIAISGGNDKSTFRFSYSNLGSKSATPNNHLDRNSFNLRATHRPIQAVLMDINVTYAQSSVDNPALQGSNSVIYAASYQVPRNWDIRYWMKNYIDTALGGISDRDISGASRAFWQIYENKYKRDESNFRGNFNLRTDITKWLRFDGSASFNQIGTYYTGSVRGTSDAFVGGDYTVDQLTVQQQRYNGSLNYLNKFGDFDILVKVGGEVNTSKGHGVWLSTNGLIVPDVYRLSNNAGNNIETREAKPNRSQNTSLFFQGSFGYKNFLSLNIYGRNDWNSTLVYNDGHGNYSYFYPGADLAFVFTEPLKLPQFVDFGKLRLSYAKVGGGTVPYKTSTGAYTNYGTYVDPNGNTVIKYGILGSSLPNLNLLPVSNTKFETGLEFKLFKNRLGGDITWYQQNSKNQIQDFSIPAVSGVRSALINGGEVKNTGVEITLYGTPLKMKDFSWDVLLNYARNRNTILSLPFDAQYAILDQEDGIYSVANLGGDYGAIRAPYSYAYYQAKNSTGGNVESPLNGMPVVSFSATGGLLGNPVMFYQRAGTYNPTVGNDAQPVIGSTLPKFLGSARNTFNYKRLSLSVFLDAKFGGDVYSRTHGYGSQYGMIKSTLFGRTAELGGLAYQSNTNYNGQTPGPRNDGILPVGVFAPNTTIPASASADGQVHNVSGMTVAEAYAKGWIKPTPAADYYDRTYGWGSGLRSMSTFESSWVSLREVSVSYELPQQVASKIGMNNLRISLTGTNLLFLYNNAPDHVNPDNLSSTSSGAFIENGGTPYFRQFGFTVNANF
jgi:iron complex outermembrane receptor protein